MSKVIKLTLPTPFKVGPVNVYLIKGNTLTLVDCGPKTEEAWKVLKEELKKYHLNIKDIDQLLITHHHEDHSGLIEWILNEKEMPVLGHPESIPYLEKDQHFLEARGQFFASELSAHGVPKLALQLVHKIQAYFWEYGTEGTLTQSLKEEDLLPGEDDWQVVYTPGHAPDHLSLFHKQTGEMVIGDHLIKHISSNAFIEPKIVFDPETGSNEVSERHRSLLEYRNALQNLLQLPIQNVYSGHGEDIEDAHRLIKERIKKQDERAQKILSLLDQPKDAFTISRSLFPELFMQELPLTMSEVIGHLDLLVEQQQVNIFQHEGIYYYEAI